LNWNTDRHEVALVSARAEELGGAVFLLAKWAGSGLGVAVLAAGVFEGHAAFPIF
jgi:hypothetical protein